MLYVTEVLDDDKVSVIDTKDSVVETVSFETAINLVKQGVRIWGISPREVEGIPFNLFDNFKVHCIEEVNAEFRKARFKNYSQLFSWLSDKFFKCLKDINDNNITPVKPAKVQEPFWVADNIKELCILHRIDCAIVDTKNITSEWGIVFKGEYFNIYSYNNGSLSLRICLC